MNPLVPAEKTLKFRDIMSIMKDPLLKAKLTNLVDEATRAKQRIYTEQLTIKDLRDIARNELQLNPKLFNAYVNSSFNNDYTARRDSANELVDLFDTIIGLLPEGNSNHESDD